MPSIVVFELASGQQEARDILIAEGGFLNSLVGFSTLNAHENIQSDLPSQVLFHPDLDSEQALQEIRVVADRFHISIDTQSHKARVVAFDIDNRGLYNWRGIVSRFHPYESND